MIRRSSRVESERRGRRAGFTLLEVIVAVAILGAGIAALLSMFSGSLTLAGGARDVSVATVYASQRLEEALLAPGAAPGVESGAFGEKYRWETRTVILPPTEESPFEGARIDVTLSWDDAGTERTIDLYAIRWKSTVEIEGEGDR